MLDEEAKVTSSDGFMSRFLVATPEPSRISLKDLKEPSDSEKTSMSNLFVTVKLIHIEPIRYTFKRDAFEFLSDCVDDYNMISQKNERINPFLRYL